MGFAKSCGCCALAGVALLVAGCGRDGSRAGGSGIPPAPAPEFAADEAVSEPVPETPPSHHRPGNPDPAAELTEVTASGSAAALEPQTDSNVEVLTPEDQALRSHVRDLEFESLQAIPYSENGEAVLAPFDEEAEPSLLDELNDTAIPDDFSLAETREARLRATRSELPLILNSQVVRLINYFTTGRGRRTFQRTIDRSEAYRPMIERVLEEEGVPPEIFHVAQAESGFRPLAISRARATGMWQFMRSTGRQYGLRQNRYVDERYDPEKATRAAARHLKDLYLEFGDWYLAMAAYNGGPMRVARSVKKAGSDYWTLCRRRLLRRETRNYVPIILAMTYVAKNPWLRESAEPDPAPPLRYDTTTTDSEIHLNLIADVTGATTEKLRELNPALRRSATPPHSYDLRLPQGAARTFEREIAHIPQEKRLAWRRHQVKEKETLSAIAKRYGIKSSQIAELNRLDGGELDQGSLLTIPSGAQKIKYYYRGGAGGFLVGGTGRYRIARGDTLGGIAQRFRTSVRQIQRWNGLTGTRIIAGRYLIVKPEGLSGKTAAGSQTGGPGKYRVRSGDNLSVIARRYGVSVGQLKQWNGLTSSRITSGRYLRVRAPGSVSTTRRASNDPSRSSSHRRAARVPIPASGRYKIRTGDSLSTIAGRFDVTIGELRAWNGLRGSRIRAGKFLIVDPTPSGGSSARSSAQAENRARSTAFSAAAGASSRYKIRLGDSLGGIAQKFGVTVKQLKAWNGLRSSRIRAGDSLTIGQAPTGRSASSSARSPELVLAASGPGRYRIRPGDTLSVIASRFGVSVAELKAWNGLRSSRIRAGRYLNVKPPSSGS